MAGPGDPVDARSDRALQSTLGVLLLAAFVFRMPWIVVVAAVLAAVGALAGASRNPFHRAFAAWAVPRLPAGETLPAATVRSQDVVAAVLLLAAIAAWGLGIAVVGWAFAMVEAVFAIAAATTGVHVGPWLAQHLSRPHP